MSNLTRRGFFGAGVAAAVVPSAEPSMTMASVRASADAALEQFCEAASGRLYATMELYQQGFMSRETMLEMVDLPEDALG